MKQIATYIYKGKEYNVELVRKRMKNIRYRLVDDTFKISAPYLASNGSIKRGLDKFAPLLVQSQKPSYVGDDYIYIFGNKYPFSHSGGEMRFSDGQILKYLSFEDFEKKMKKLYLPIVTSRVRYYENLMGLKPHNVRIRKMSSRYGSNSKHTHTVTFSLKLYAYSIDILDAIVVHELSHTVVFNHSKAFYDVVYKYCPNYEVLHKKLRKGVFL
ncbi:MAG: M48 family metallopeptidase [Bacilli bacterium]|nr:M48 family metallopeptidase [Bacilli bacterium]